MERTEREKLAHDTEIDIGAPDEDSAYVTLRKLRSLLADSERCERLEGALREVLSNFRVHSPQMSGRHVYQISLLGDRANKLRETVEAALEVPDGE